MLRLDDEIREALDLLERVPGAAGLGEVVSRGASTAGSVPA